MLDRRGASRSAALLCAAALIVSVAPPPAAAQAVDAKALTLTDPVSLKRVYLKRATRSEYEIHLSEKYFPNLERHFGKLKLLTITIEPVLGYAPRELATFKSFKDIAAHRLFVARVDPKPCTVKLIHDPPASKIKGWRANDRIDYWIAYYNHALRVCAKGADKPLMLAIEMFRARALKEACEFNGYYGCADALATYDRILGAIETKHYTAAHFKAARVSNRIIRVRVIQLLQRALEEGMRFYVKNRNTTDRAAVLAYLERIRGHKMVSRSTKIQAGRARYTVLVDACRAEEGDACVVLRKERCRLRPDLCRRKKPKAPAQPPPAAQKNDG